MASVPFTKSQGRTIFSAREAVLKGKERANVPVSARKSLDSPYYTAYQWRCVPRWYAFLHIVRMQPERRPAELRRPCVPEKINRTKKEPTGWSGSPAGKTSN